MQGVVDVLVVGAGPAGMALAAACAERGLRTTLVDPTPERPWRATYAAWRHELPTHLPTGVLAATVSQARAVARTDHALPEYVVLDNTALRAHLQHPDVVMRPGKAVGVVHSGSGSTVLLADGERLAAALVVDATGARRALTGGPPQRPTAEQSAFGLLVPEDLVRDLLAPGEALFMDWRPAPDRSGGWPTFLYAVPVGGGQVLVEETSLAHRPGLPAAVLRRRLCSRLDALGVPRHTLGPRERVLFPLDLPVPRPRRVVPFGSAAALVHPATGYSVATSLTLAPRVAQAIADTLPHGPAAAVTAAWRALWPPTASVVHMLRRRGLEALLTLPEAEVPEFFEAFFALPEHLRRAYLSGREDLRGTVTAMAAVFREVSWRLRGRLALASTGLQRIRPPFR